MKIKSVRNSYKKRKKILSEESVRNNPFEQFSIWMGEVLNFGLIEPNAMILSTASLDALPTSRTVLLKEFSENGFVFYTNYQSAKAKDLSENPYASLLFLWLPLQRQVRITGKVKKVSRAVSRKYFVSRPKDSQIGAWASHQSSVIPNRFYLDARFEFFNKKFKNRSVPLPPFWGGYRLIPNSFEFWQGRNSRLHDRIKYTLVKKKWKIERLSP